MKTEIESVLKRYEQWNNDLYKRYIKKFNRETTIWDGVIFPDEYANSALKVMVLNREAYGDPQWVPYNVCKAIQTCIKDNTWVFPGQNTLRTHLKQYLAVMNLAHKSSMEMSDDEVRECVQSTDYNDFIESLKGVAYCNVKKSDGKPKSIKSDLFNYAKNGLDILKEQIRYFNPSIILAGNVCEGVLEDLVEWGDDLYIGPDRRICIWQLRIDDDCFPFVDMYHPSLAQGMSEYYLELFHALQAVEKERPGFWNERIDNTKNCFITR